MGETTDFWAGEGGDAYTIRCRVDWRRRIPFWQDLIERIGPRSVYEVGCNAGWNLSAIHRVRPDVQCYGHDPNLRAINQAKRAGLLNVHLGGDFPMQWFYGGGTAKPQINPIYEPMSMDLVFASGVLIHIEPMKLQALMAKIIDLSAGYVLAIEYADEKETEIEYQGRSGLLWRRPYGRIYQEMGLKLVDEWDAGPGFDRCTAWLMEKA